MSLADKFELRIKQIQTIQRLAKIPNATGMGSELTAAQAAIKVAETNDSWDRAIELFFAK